MEGAEDSLVGMVVGMKRGGKSEAEGGKGWGGGRKRPFKTAAETSNLTVLPPNV